MHTITHLNLFASTPDGVFLSTNNGTTWTEVNLGLTTLSVQSFAVNDTYLFAGMYAGGVWRRPISEIITSVDRFSSHLPVDFTLEQNYPNPFNPSTKIKYSIHQTSNVVITVFDVLGNEIETLASEVKPAGTYEIHWNAANLPSGIYFYQLEAGRFVETKKMVLMK